MDANNPVVELCIKGSQAEFEGRKWVFRIKQIET